MCLAALKRTAGRTLVDPEFFDRLARRVATEHDGVSREFAERIADQTLAFVGAAAVNDGPPLRPGRLVNLGWHEFLLFTREYDEVCRSLGRFVHHVPDAPAGLVRAVGAADELARTAAAIDAAGYVVDPDLWAPSADKCGSCHEEGNCSGSGKDGNENTETRKQ